MSPKNYFQFSGTIFLIVTIIHLLRVLKDWDVSIGNFDLPMWGSWAAIIIAGSLAYNGLRRK